MTKNEIIEKTLKEIGPRLKEHEVPYSEAPTCEEEEIVIAELKKRLPDTDIKTCEDFRHLNVVCCDTCHTFYPHYEMKVIQLPDGSPAWVCDTVECIRNDTKNCKSGAGTHRRASCSGKSSARTWTSRLFAPRFLIRGLGRSGIHG